VRAGWVVPGGLRQTGGGVVGRGVVGSGVVGRGMVGRGVVGWSPGVTGSADAGVAGTVPATDDASGTKSSRSGVSASGRTPSASSTDTATCTLPLYDCGTGRTGGTALRPDAAQRPP